ncbi:MAG TPA: response regulator [Roseiflexaceae bacterium]|nr:response regulator [Roseiflexaceae bacterium]
MMFKDVLSWQAGKTRVVSNDRVTGVGVTEKAMPILIVEDDAAIREVLSRVLEDEGYTVFIANDGRDALEHLRAVWPLPSLIILDLMMPRMNGLAFRSAQRADSQLADIPVVVLSAASQLDRHTAPLEAAAVVPKPFDLDQLLSTVAMILA